MLARALSFLFLAIGLASCAPSDGPLPRGAVELSPAFTADFALTGVDGEAVADEDFEGEIMLIYLGFTNCPDVCPGDIGVLSAALDALGASAGDVAPIFITVDPERDTPQALADYFAFDERIRPLTGSPQAAKAARESFKAFAAKVPLSEDEADYTVDHTRFFYVTDRAGQPIFALAGGAGPEDLAGLVRRALRTR